MADGIYRKFKVTRADRSEKHEDCRYFVLDLDHDEHARAALTAYAKHCRKARPTLAEDIDEMLAASMCGCRELDCGCLNLFPDMGSVMEWKMNHA